MIEISDVRVVQPGAARVGSPPAARLSATAEPTFSSRAGEATISLSDSSAL